MANPRQHVAQGQLLCACSPCYGDGLIHEGEYYWQYVGNYTVPFNICWSCYHLEPEPRDPRTPLRDKKREAAYAHPDAA